MPIVHPCSAPDCATLTMGTYCLACEQAPARPREPRGRGMAVAAVAGAAAGFVAAFVARARLSL